jgi:hypothetical protein
MDQNDPSPLSRRQLVGTASVGLGAALGAPAAAQTHPTAAPMADPTAKYPRPPFMVAALAGPGEPDGSPAGSRRDQLSRLGPARRARTKLWR